MKKSYLLLLAIMAFNWNAKAQFSCGSGVALSAGYTASGITTPGNGGAADWVTAPTGTTIDPLYWDDDVYLFQYTAGATPEQISMTTYSRNSWNGIGIFTTCSGTSFSGQLAAQGTTGSNATKTVTAVVNPGQTVYIITGQWGTPNGLDFDVTSFTVTPISSAPNCTAFTGPLTGATNVLAEGIFTWTAATNASGYKLNLGTTAGGTDVLNMTDVGNVLTYNIPGALQPLTTYYATVIAYNSIGSATGCTEISFTTGAVPANDNCSGAIALTVNPDYTCTATTSGTLVNATNSGVADTGAGVPDDDVWYSFTATATTHIVTLSGVTGSPTDLVHEVMSGDCAVLTSVSISDPDTSMVTGLTPGNTYYVRVFTYAEGGTPTTNFTICIGTPPAPPANDNCAAAVALTVNADYLCGANASGTLAGATNSGVADTGAGTPDDDVWYSFVATAATHRIVISNVTGTPTDLVHEVMSGNCGTLTSVSISDSDTSNPSGLVVGNTYYVRVFTYDSNTVSTTAFKICIGTQPPPPPAPANDLCSAAASLATAGTFAASAVTGTTDGATSTTGLTFACQTNRNNDVWYRVIVPASGSLTLETKQVSGSPLTDTVMSVFSGACGTLTEIACNDDDGDGNHAIINLTGQTPGATLYVGVWKWNSATNGTFQVGAYDASLSAPDFDSDNFKAYPNPVKDVLNLSYTQNITQVSVFNMLGQQVIARTANETESHIDMTSLAKGTYLVKVTSGAQVKTIKVVKE